MAFKDIVKLDCSVKRFEVQNDLRDWEIDQVGAPVKVINEKYWIMKQISVDPKYIPAEKVLLEKITIVKDKDNNDIQVVEYLEPERAIKEAIEKEIAKTDPKIDVPIDPIKEVKP